MYSNTPERDINGSSLISTSSLEPNSSSQALDFPLTECKVSDFRLANQHTGELFCPYCNHRRLCVFHADREACWEGAAIALAKPDYHMTVTGLPDNWEDIRDGMNRFKRRLAKDLAGFRCWYAVEPNRRGTGHHAHCFVDHVRTTVLQLTEYSQEAGLGLVDERPLTPIERGHYYPLKEMRMKSYGSLAEARKGQNRFLDINGSRLGHHTKNFFRDRDGYLLSRAEALEIVKRDWRDRQS
jgi:hypothetical protein